MDLMIFIVIVLLCVIVYQLEQVRVSLNQMKSELSDISLHTSSRRNVCMDED